MDLSHYVQALRRWLWLILLVSGLAGAIGYGVSLQVPPTYEATTLLLIQPPPANGAANSATSLFARENLAGTIAELLHHRPVVEAVISRLKLSDDIDTVTSKIDIRTIRDTQLIILAVDDENPQTAAAIANETVNVFIEQSRELQQKNNALSRQALEQSLAEAQENLVRSQATFSPQATPETSDQLIEQTRQQVQLEQFRRTYAAILTNLERLQQAEASASDIITVVDKAFPPESSARPRPRLNAVIALIVGAILATGLIVLYEYFDDRVRTGHSVEHGLGLPTLASLARIQATDPAGRLVVAKTPNSAEAETYRWLAARIKFAADESPIGALVITSGDPVEAKSVLTANLGVALAQAGKRVILVDANLRKPHLHTFFHRHSHRGVTTALLERDDSPVSAFLVATGIDNLSLLPTGMVPPNASALVASQSMVELIEELKTQADIVLLDSPPVLGFVDALHLAAAADATLLVAQAASTRMATLKQARDKIMETGGRLLGVALTHVVSTSDTRYYYPHDGASQRAWPFTGWLRLPQLLGRNSSPTVGHTASVDTPVVPTTISEK